MSFRRQDAFLIVNCMEEDRNVLRLGGSETCEQPIARCKVQSPFEQCVVYRKSISNELPVVGHLCSGAQASGLRSSRGDDIFYRVSEVAQLLCSTLLFHPEICRSRNRSEQIPVPRQRQREFLDGG